MDTIAEQQADENEVAPAEPKPQVEPRGVVFHAVVAIFFALILLGSFHTPLDFDLPGLVWIVGGFWGIVILSAAYLSRLLVWLFSSNRSMERLWVWPVAPLLAVGAILLAASDMPQRLRFELNQSEFERAIAELEDRQFAEGLLVRDPVQIGSYEITLIRAEGNAVIFREAGGWDSVHGVIFAPDGPPSEWDQVRYPTFTDLGDGWYAYFEQW